MTDADLMRACDDYLASRTGCYAYRMIRYEAAADLMFDRGLSDTDTVLDVGAGWTEFGRYLREEGWAGRYWPVDGWQGIDLEEWRLEREVTWSVALEVIEHITQSMASDLIASLKTWSSRGVIVSTPNPLTTDVLGMDATHKWGVDPLWLLGRGFSVEARAFYGNPQDSLFAWRLRDGQNEIIPEKIEESDEAFRDRINVAGLAQECSKCKQPTGEMCLDLRRIQRPGQPANTTWVHRERIPASLIDQFETWLTNHTHPKESNAH